MNTKSFKTQWGDRELKVEFGRFAEQAHGACTVQYGDTLVLATVVKSEGKREGIDYFPLMVDFEEKMYAAGKIKGSRFVKREGRPTDEAILSARLVDRSIRPLFDESVRNDVQVILTILSVDGENDPDVPALLAASLAIMTSGLLWKGPIGSVRIGQKDDAFIVNPTYAQLDESPLDLFVAGTSEKVIMIEAGGKEVPEDTMLEAIAFAQKELAPLMDFIKETVKKVGAKAGAVSEKSQEEQDAAASYANALRKAQAVIKKMVDTHLFNSPKASKQARKDAFAALGKALDAHLEKEGIDEVNRARISKELKQLVEAEITNKILEDGTRVDGRALDEVRPLDSEIGLLPRTHGSAHFLRGETQVLSVVTLGAPGDKQILDTMEEDDTKKRYMHHYNFPPFSVGEVGVLRGPGRRDIGHGALAEKALMPVLPEEDKFPYTIRVVSEVMGSNGSSSMASTCGSSLALMDAGVPIRTPVAGVAIGLASNEDMSKWKILTDIQDLEDGKGGMDFKIAGTEAGITAIQLDTKTDGLPAEIIEEAVSRARKARLEILKSMQKTITEPRADLSPYAPRIEIIKIDPEKIREVIGPGGKIINKIIADTGVSIDIEQDGTVFVTSEDAEQMKRAIKMVTDIVKEVEVGETYEGPIVRLEDFGAFVQILPNKDGMVHVSEIAWERVERPSDRLKMGDVVKVKVKEIDNLGRVNLSMKALLPRPEGMPEYTPSERPPRRDDRGGRGGDRRGPRGGRPFRR
ncbi:MAG: polyribonucleotide nucleotidyltransferase [Candidatus Magasanikbacteria bacterium]|nr:polyribonucleotide nucleotidyltransferase [Candidatus Magasanikbacteria bacterium]